MTLTPEQRILQLGQSVYQTRNGKPNDIDAGTETTDFVNLTIEWFNQFLEELEAEADWNYVRTNNSELGTITDLSVMSYTLPVTVNHLIRSPYRDLTIQQDGIVVATFKVVNPNQIADPTNPDTCDRCTVLGPKNNRHLIFSRELTETELNGKIVADVISYIPRLSLTDVSALDIVEPFQLVILGMAKNSTLSDIVKSNISPALAQKYADLLAKAIAANNATSDSYDIPRESFSFIRGTW